MQLELALLFPFSFFRFSRIICSDMKLVVALLILLVTLSACGTPLPFLAAPRSPTPVVTAIPSRTSAATLTPTAPPTATRAATTGPTVPAVTTIPPSAAHAVVCPILATRTPPPGAPTYVPGGPVEHSAFVDPHIEICSSTATVAAGQTVSVIGAPVDIGLAYYTLSIKDDAMPDWAAVVMVTYGDEERGLTQRGEVFTLVSAQGSMNQATFVLRARRAGSAQFRISATGEVHYGYPGPATMMGGGGSDSIGVTVTE